MATDPTGTTEDTVTDAGELDRPAPSVTALGPVTRRRFIVVGGAALGSLTLEGRAWGAVRRRHRPKVESVADSLLDNVALDGSSQTLLLVRREDLVRIQLDLFNMTVKGNRLALNNPSQPGYLVYTFGPQHVVEQAIYEDQATATTNTFSGPLPSSGNSTTGPVPAPGGVAARLAGPSRVAVEVYAVDLPALDFETLLSLPGLLSVAPLASTGPGGGFSEPDPTQTAIELPWRLVLTPDSTTSFFATPDGLRLNDGRAELWTARLSSLVDGDSIAEGGTFRAPWTYDLRTVYPFGTSTTVYELDRKYPFSGPPPAPVPGSKDPADAQFPVVQAMTVADRWNITQATNNPSLGGARQPVQADRLWLSARGGHLDSVGSWQLPQGSPASNLRQWKHRATAGRDQYVKVVDNGYLFPFGHRATVTVVSEREFQRASNGQGPTVAFLRQYAYITILEPSRSFDQNDFPFRTLELLTDRTPPIEAQQITPSSNTKAPAGNPPQTSYTDGWVPYLNGSPYQFHYLATDWVGRKISFTAGALFVLEAAADSGDASQYIEAWNGLATSDPTRQSNLGAQKIAFAPPSNASKPGDTDLHTLSVSFAARFAASAVPAVLPTLAQIGQTGANDPQAVVTLAVAEQLSGGAPLPGNSQPAFAYHPTYAAHGFDNAANPGRVYLKSVAKQAGLQFANGSSGGVITPNIGIDGLSRSLGPVADSDNIATGTFKPANWFADIAGAAFLGGITLAKIIADDTIDAASSDTPPTTIPKVTAVPSDDPTVLTTSVVWQPEVDQSSGLLTAANDGTTLTIDLNATITTAAGQTSYVVNGVIPGTTEPGGFVYTLFPGSNQFIALTFTSLTFSAGTGQKTKLQPVLDSSNGVEFIGSLSFINALESLMSFAGDGGLAVNVDASGVHADVTASLPPIGLGLFSISGVSFYAGLDLPLDGISPAVFTFSFASQADPFTISGGIFGGGGYFVMAIGTSSVQMIQISFDFGAVVVLDLGIASGGVSLEAGIAYTYSTSPDSCELQAWVTFKGSLEILGIITLSLEFDLTLNYQQVGGANQLYGTATLYVGIGLFGFTKTISLTASKTFEQSGSVASGSFRRALAGVTGPSAPTFAEQMDQNSWANHYCNCFA